MKKKRILAMLLAVTSCLSLAVSASAANTVNRKATDFRDFDKSAWYAEAVSAAVDNGLLYGKSATIIDPDGDMTRAEMAAIINRSFGCYAKADISKYKDVSKDKWYFEDVAMAVQMGTYNGRSNTAMVPDAPITRQEAMPLIWLNCVSWNEELNMTRTMASARRKPLKSRSMICLKLTLPQKPNSRPAPEKTICICGINT